MRIVYQAENIVDAHLIKGTLGAYGIVAFVTGEYLTGAMGQLPACGLVSVMVADDIHAEAARIVAELLHERTVDAAIEPIAAPGCVPKPA